MSEHKLEMSFPDIPAQDLAKLVLGYLAEEQLMTAYDEFLQSSPYLDALHNEYDRIFMTSLKHIVSEYRAVRILVETCQPVNLRRKLLQCGNLLEMIKFLINNVDVQSSPPLSNSQLLFRTKRESRSFLQNCKSSCRYSGHGTCVETTPLADLPGYMHSGKKHVKVLSPEAPYDGVSGRVHCGLPSADSEGASEDQHGHNKSHLEGSVQDACSLSIRHHNISEQRSSSHVLSTSRVGTTSRISPPSNHGNRESQESRASDVNRTQLIDANNYKSNTPLAPTPKSTRNINSREFQKINPKIDITLPNLYRQPDKITCEPRKMQYLLQVTTKSNNKNQSDCQNNNFQGSRGNDPKITIISDVKVDRNVSNLQSLLNGTTFRSDGGGFTNEEIMAMPTIFIVPSTAPPLVSPINPIQPTCVQNTSLITATSRTSMPSLGPLTIDVDSPNKNKSDNPELQTTSKENLCNRNTQFTSGGVTNLEHKNASLPKDNTMRVNKSSTPHVVPLARKSCSTPRRSSHIRVLDFATPRRIIREGLNENGQENEVLISRSPNLMICEQDEVPKRDNQTNEQITATDQPNKDVKPKKSNWDADLRALLENSANAGKSETKRKKKRSTEKISVKKSRPSTSKKSPKVKIVQSKCRSAKKKLKNSTKKKEDEYVSEPVPAVSVKPTINIVTEWNPSPPKDINKSVNKSNTEEQSDTPEMDRISLQNVIGAKLNISDLLETPYKQALYDIQMETPRFLQPDIPGDPISEVKITDIPTPRFLSSALGQTPSSYSSRPTDYSSGGSYYKPDEHDYLPILDGLDNLAPAKTKTDKQTKNSKNKTNGTNRKSVEKSTRPVRQCTKNVSYVDIQARSTEKKSDPETSFSDTSTICDEDKRSKTTPRTNLTQDVKSSGSKRKISPKSKKLSPKKFMKIKPRKPTPASSRKPRKESLAALTSISPKYLNRKRTFSKEKTEKTPVATSAPTKSRRKSSTPRKLNTKKFHSLSPEEVSPTEVTSNTEVHRFTAPVVNNDSDTEHINLRWSDDGSRASSEVAGQSDKSKASPTKGVSNEAEDISKIQEYIEKVTQTPNVILEEDAGSLHLDLIKRGFDAETARSIERDLLDGTSPVYNVESKNVPKIIETVQTNPITEITAQKKQSTQYSEELETTIEMDSTKADDDKDTPQIDVSTEEDVEEEEEEIELSMHECNEDTNNYFTCSHNNDKDTKTENQVRIKDTWSMEIALEERTIRLRTGPLTSLFNDEPTDIENESLVETEAAVSSISNIDKLYTPMKDRQASIQAQCIEIFDSTLTSLDTPLKSPRNDNVTITEIVLEVEQVVEKFATDSKTKCSIKRKRLSGSCSDESLTDGKKSKREPRYIPNIQNIDIESVLSKLHGP